MHTNRKEYSNLIKILQNPNLSLLTGKNVKTLPKSSMHSVGWLGNLDLSIGNTHHVGVPLLHCRISVLILDSGTETPAKETYLLCP